MNIDSKQKEQLNRHKALQIWFLAILLLLTVFSYSRIVRFEFLHWDDNMIITQNPYVKQLNSDALSHNISSERFTFLTLVSFSAMVQIWGDNPMPFHVFSLLLHVLNVVMVFLVMRHFTKNTFILTFISILFALHPMRVEAVAWISETKGLLMAFFSLASFLCYLKYLRSNLHMAWFVAVALLAILASLSKITALLLPFTLLLFDMYFNRKIDFRAVIEKLVLFLLMFFLTNIQVIAVVVVLFAAYLVLRNRMRVSRNISIILAVTGLLAAILYLSFINQPQLHFSYFRNDPDSTMVFGVFQRILLSGFALFLYFKFLLLPLGVSAIYPYPVFDEYGSLPVAYYATLLVLAAVVAVTVLLIVYRSRIQPVYRFGWFFFLFNISVFLHWVPIEGRVVAADRYTYLPYLGLFMIMAFFIDAAWSRFIRSRTGLLVFMGIATLILSVAVFQRTKVWANTKTLMKDVISNNNQVGFAHSLMAAYYMSQNQNDSAIVCFNRAIKIDANDFTAYFNRAFAYWANKNYDLAISDFDMFTRLTKVPKNRSIALAHIGEIYRTMGADSLALAYFDKAIEIDAFSSVAHNRRGLIYLNRAEYEKARSDFAKAVDYSKFNAEAYNNLGLVYTILENYEQALVNYNKAIELSPQYAMAYDNRAYLHYLKGDFKAALSDYNTEISLRPGNIQAYLNRGRVYAAQKNFVAAISDFNYVLQQQPDDIQALTNRAYALYYSGDVEGAGVDFEKMTIVYSDNLQVWHHLAWFYMQTGNSKAAISCLKQALEIDTNHEAIIVNLAALLVQDNNYAEAEKYLLRALEINNKNAEAYYALGKLYYDRGDKKAACAYYKRAADNNHAAAINAMQEFCK